MKVECIHAGCGYPFEKRHEDQVCPCCGKSQKVKKEAHGKNLANNIIDSMNKIPDFDDSEDDDGWIFPWGSGGDLKEVSPADIEPMMIDILRSKALTHGLSFRKDGISFDFGYKKLCAASFSYRTAIRVDFRVEEDRSTIDRFIEIAPDNFKSEKEFMNSFTSCVEYIMDCIKDQNQRIRDHYASTIPLGQNVFYCDNSGTGIYPWDPKADIDNSERKISGEIACLIERSLENAGFDPEKFQISVEVCLVGEHKIAMWQFFPIEAISNRMPPKEELLMELYGSFTEMLEEVEGAIEDIVNRYSAIADARYCPEPSTESINEEPLTGSIDDKFVGFLFYPDDLFMDNMSEHRIPSIIPERSETHCPEPLRPGEIWKMIRDEKKKTED